MDYRSLLLSAVPYGYGDEDMLHKRKINDILVSVLELIFTKSLQVQQGHFKASIKSNPTLIAFKPAQEAARTCTVVYLAELSLVFVVHSWPERLFQMLDSKEGAESFSFEHGSSSPVCETHIPVIWSHLSDFINADLPPTEDPD